MRLLTFCQSHFDNIYQYCLFQIVCPRRTCAPFSASDLVYIHCIDSNVKFEYTFSEIASLNLVTVLGHISLSSDLRSRRRVLFLHMNEFMGSLTDKRSPVLCRVKESCFFLGRSTCGFHLSTVFFLCGDELNIVREIS